VLFQPGGSQILDSRGDLVCMVVPEGQVFGANFSQSSGVTHCFLAGSLSELWKWHRKLGHVSFDLFSRLRKLNLVQGLPLLRFEKELVCASCRHAKMVASSHPPLTDAMKGRPCELLHMDLVGPTCVRSAGEVVRPSCGRRLLSVSLGLPFGREGEDIWFCSRSCLEVEEREARRCHTSDPQWQLLRIQKLSLRNLFP
jgi:hypothetical protein